MPGRHKRQLGIAPLLARTGGGAVTRTTAGGAALPEEVKPGRGPAWRAERRTRIRRALGDFSAGPCSRLFFKDTQTFKDIQANT